MHNPQNNLVKNMLLNTISCAMILWLIQVYSFLVALKLDSYVLKIEYTTWSMESKKWYAVLKLVFLILNSLIDCLVWAWSQVYLSAIYI